MVLFASGSNAMKVRNIKPTDEGPFLSGLERCDHITYDTEPTQTITSHCKICNGTGWRIVPVVIVPDK